MNKGYLDGAPNLNNNRIILTFVCMTVQNYFGCWSASCMEMVFSYKNLSCQLYWYFSYLILNKMCLSLFCGELEIMFGLHTNVLNDTLSFKVGIK